MNETRYWTLHMFAGVFILVLLGLHMITMHLDGIFFRFNPLGGEAIDWQNVFARGKSILTTVNYIILLAAALFHGLFGLRTIIFELAPSPNIKKVISGLFILSGSALFITGCWATIKFHLIAQAV